MVSPLHNILSQPYITKTLEIDRQNVFFRTLSPAITQTQTRPADLHHLFEEMSNSFFEHLTQNTLSTLTNRVETPLLFNSTCNELDIDGRRQQVTLFNVNDYLGRKTTKPFCCLTAR